MEKGDRPVDFARLKVNTCLKYIVNEDESPHVLSYLGTSVTLCARGKVFWLCVCMGLGKCVCLCFSLYVCVSVCLY